MAMTVLKARDTGTDYVLHIHLDSTRLVPDPDLPAPPPGQPDPRPLVPDPAWVREFTFGKAPPAGRTAAQYLTDIRREVKGLCQADLARLTALPTAGTALAIEGLEL